MDECVFSSEITYLDILMVPQTLLLKRKTKVIVCLTLYNSALLWDSLGLAIPIPDHISPAVLQPVDPLGVKLQKVR